MYLSVRRSKHALLAIGFFALFVVILFSTLLSVVFFSHVSMPMSHFEWRCRYFAERGTWDSTLDIFINSDGDPTQFAVCQKVFILIPPSIIVLHPSPSPQQLGKPSLSQIEKPQPNLTFPRFVIVSKSDIIAFRCILTVYEDLAITTVGYGEITPRSFLGRLITLPLLVFGLLLIALPSFVLGREFSLVWESMTRDQVISLLFCLFAPLLTDFSFLTKERNIGPG